MQPWENKVMEYFCFLSDDVLLFLFNFLSINDSIVVLFVCKRWSTLLKSRESRWKKMSLDFWSEFKSELSFNTEDEFDLEKAQKNSGKDWIWISRCFASGRIFGGIDLFGRSMCIGFESEVDVCGNGIWIGRRSSYVGEFNQGRFDGIGTYVSRYGIRYIGKWFRGKLYGKASLLFPDGVHETRIYKADSCESVNDRHPSAQECIDKDIWIDTLQIKYPKRSGIESKRVYWKSLWK
jgi:hypothetical protein